MSSENYLKSFDDELQNEIELLSYEFETLNLPSLEDLYSHKRLLLMQLIDNVHSLIKLHRSIIESNSQILINETRNQKELGTIRDELMSTKFELNLTNKQLVNMQNQCKLLEAQVDECENEKKKLSDHILQLKKQNQSKVEEYDHKLKALQNHNDQLTNKLTFGTYKSQDQYISEALMKYKMKEDIYKETIKDLTNSNTAVMEEVISLREMICDSISNRNNDCQ